MTAGRGMSQGYKNIIDKGIEVDAPLAIETSGHGAMKENYSMLGDDAVHEHPPCADGVTTRVHGGLHRCYVAGVPYSFGGHSRPCAEN